MGNSYNLPKKLVVVIGSGYDSLDLIEHSGIHMNQQEKWDSRGP